jgi:hypothetical protein
MKKIISVLLAILMIFTCTIPAFASTGVEHLPIIVLVGDGTQIYMPDETAENGEKNVWGDLFANMSGDGKVTEAVANILLPFLTEGLLFDKWDNYYDAFYEEIAPIFDPLRMDSEGNPRYGTGLGKEDLQSNATSCKQNPYLWNGSYGTGDYVYRYDWRRDPLEVAEELHLYILEVMKTTGKTRVNLAANCLGGSYVLAYLSKYGTDGHIKNVFFNATVGNGTDLLTDAYCGDIVLDDAALQRFLHQNVEKDGESVAGLLKTTPFINELILTSYDLLAQTHVVETLGLTFDSLYQKIYAGLVPKLAIAIFATMPGYWSVVTPERYEEAKNFVFGKEGDEMYEEYKGLVAKLDKYYETVSSKKVEIIENCQEAGVHFGASAKYGYQMYPFVKSQSELGDQLVDLEHASFGATVAPNVYATLSDEHIQAAIKGGTDKYISPDNMVDASTSLFKDSLWIMKNVSHSNTSFDYPLIATFCRNTEFTINSDSRYPQYHILLPDTMEKDPETGALDNSTGKVVPMTTENCNLTIWDEMPEESKEEPTVVSRIMSFFRWLTAMIKFILHISDENPGAAPV